jgi:hypothetical protein
MTALSVQPPFPILTDIDGQPLDDGFIFIGVVNLAPITNPITVYWDAALTVTATQPIRTRGGYPMNAGVPGRLYVNSDYSIQVQNRNGSVVYSSPTATERFGDLIGSVALLADITTLRTTIWTSGRPQIVQLINNHIAGDGGGFFRWDAASTATDNNGTRVKEDATATGRWLRQVNDGWVAVEWFGLVLSADEATAPANTTAMQRALNTGYNVLLPSGEFWCGAVTQTTRGQIVEGDQRTLWRHPVVALSNLIQINATAIGAIWRNFRIDGNSANVVYNYNSSEFVWFATDVTIENVQLKDCQSMGARAIGPADRTRVLNCRFENCGDFGFFANNAGTGDAIDGIVDGNTVLNFGLAGFDSAGIGVRSAVGGWKVTNNTITQTVAVGGVTSRLGVEFWVDSNNGVIANNVVDMTLAGDFGLSCTGKGLAVTGNVVRGSTAYAIEIVDRACTVVGNVIRSPLGAGIAINLNALIADPGDYITVTGNTIENITTTNVSLAGIIVDGDPATDPVAVTISGNTLHGLGNLMKIADYLKAFTISGNTFYNTGSAVTALLMGGDDGLITGNTFVRVPAAGTGNQAQAINIGGNCSGITISDNHFIGNSRIANGITIVDAASDIYVSNNHFTGILSNSVFSTSTSPSVVIIGGFGNVSATFNAANKVFGFINSGNNNFQTNNVLPGVGVYTVANLPTDVIAGQTAYASNGRKAGEGAGSGTGVLVFRDTTAWRACDTGATVAA